MALLDDITKNVTPTGIAVSVGTVLLAPYLVPALSSVLRPAARGVLSAGIQLYRQAMEPVSNAVSGLVTEAQLELASAKAAAAPAAATPGAATAGTPVPKAPRRAHKETGGHGASPETADA